MQRGEYVAAQIAIGEYLKSIMNVIFLINRKYSPYYKWQRRALSTLQELSEIGNYLDEISMLPADMDAWKDWDCSLTVNLNDKRVLMIECIAQIITGKLNEMGLTDTSERYLEVQGRQIAAKIKSE